jgi:NodT family efflux transporter outer membrane factor (OMF) lipoprotein
MVDSKFFPHRQFLSGSLAIILLSACAVGPDYVRPQTTMPATFKENANWKQATPKDATIRGKWWEAFGDTELNKLEEQVDSSNQTIKAAEAQFRQARALVAEARAAYFPTVGANASFSRSGFGAGARNGSSGIVTSTGTVASTTGSESSGNITNEYSATLDASWEPDFWGRVRRTMESNKANAQANAAEVQVVKLLAEAELATDYLSLRVADEQKRLLDSTAADYARSLKLTQNQYNVGVAARSDVLQAQVQLEQTQAQLIDVGVARAQFEHAVAILVGQPPATFSIAEVSSVPGVPVIPTDVPSTLLERRPDIANTERLVAAANAQIGVAEAAFFPDITLSASGGYQSSALSKWFSMPSRIWSIGPSLAETIFDAGLRSAQTEAAIAAYDQTVANYRQTVLGGFQEVEDNLAALRIYEQEAAVQAKTVADAHAAVVIFTNQYKAGTVSYLSVVTAQTTELTNKLTALTVEKERLTAAATLIKALGGGWNTSELDKPSVTEPETTPFSFLPPSVCSASACCPGQACDPHSDAPSSSPDTPPATHLPH